MRTRCPPSPTVASLLAGPMGETDGPGLARFGFGFIMATCHAGMIVPFVFLLPGLRFFAR